MATKTYSNVRRNGRSASWVRVLKALNMSDTPLTAKEIFETAATKNDGIIRKLHNDNLISRKKIGPHNKMGYTLAYKGLKALNDAEKALRK
mgnify:CR=1 FL=1